MVYEINEIAEIIKENFESKIRMYAGPRTVNREWVMVYCTVKSKLHKENVIYSEIKITECERYIE